MHIFCFLGFFFLVCAHKSTEEQAINKIQLHTRHNYKQEVLHMLKNDGWQSKFLHIPFSKILCTDPIFVIQGVTRDALNDWRNG